MITFDGVIFSSKNNRGGVSVYFKKLLQYTCAAMNASVLIYDSRIKAAELHCQPHQLVLRPLRVAERFRSIRELSPGLLHSSYYRCSSQRDVLNVVTVYDFTYERFTRGPKRWVHSAQKYRAIRKADAIICISENTRRDLLEFLPDITPQKVFVTHLAAGDEFKPIETRTSPVTSRPYVLFVGLRAEYKNFSAAVAAVRLTQECALVCVGGGPLTDDERVTLERDLPGRYFHAGPVDVERLNELYNGAVCLIYPSLYEGFGIPPLEAMRAGCPFVALGTSSIPEVAGTAGVLLDQPDADALAMAIEKCSQPFFRAELRDRGFTQALKFSWERTVAETHAIYKRLGV